LDGTRITVDTTGAVELVTGGSAVGQGFATAMAQICAGTLGVGYRRVRVVSGQTDRIQYGIGAHALGASVMTGSATHAAALKVRAKALDMAASLLQAAPDELDIVGEVAPGDPSLHAFSLMGPMVMAMLFREVFGEVGTDPPDLQALAGQHARTALNGLLTSPAEADAADGRRTK
jgi:CO/xanthine dehydrogenase Mo-binding subunit